VTETHGVGIVTAEMITTTHVSNAQLRAVPIAIFARSASQVPTSISSFFSTTSLTTETLLTDSRVKSDPLTTQTLSAGAKAGISVGIISIILLLVGAYVVIHKMIGRKGDRMGSNETTEKISDHDGTGWWKSELDSEEVDPFRDVHEMPGKPIMELDSTQLHAELSNYNISELDSTQSLAELEGSKKESPE
jgi:hypothetical protein